jgi:hypothetical protein
LFLSPLISAWTDTANASNTKDVPPLKAGAIHHFICTLAYLSFYKQTPSYFFGNENAFPPVSRMNGSLFSRVIQGFSKPGEDDVRSVWGSPSPSCHRWSHSAIVEKNGWRAGGVLCQQPSESCT